MDFREMTYVIAIAKHQSVSKAANELYVSQPTLSKFVQNLEKELGQPLFKRLGKKFVLTYAGERYVEYAKNILNAKKELDNELSDIMKYDIGELRIAFPSTRGVYMLPCTLPIFEKLYPRVRLYVHEADSGQLESLLLDGSIDLAFFTLPLQSPELDYMEISREEVVLAMSPDHPLAKTGVKRDGCRYPWIDLKTAAGERFILQKSDQRTRKTADQLFKNAGISPENILEIRNIQASVQLAARGYGVTFVGETHLKHIPCSPAVFSVGSPCTTTSFVAAFRKGVYMSSYMRAYIRVVKEFT